MKDVYEVIRETIYKMASDKDMHITDTSNLYDEGIMDSLNTIILISQLENELNVSLPEEAFVPENFESIESICRIVKEVISEGKE